MAVTLTAAPSSTAAAVTFTVAGGSAPGVVRGLRVTGDCAAAGWLDLWAYAADGVSGEVALVPGPWLFAAFPAAGGVSAGVYRAVLDPLGAVATRCRDAVADRVRLLALPGHADRVYVRAAPIDTVARYPCVFVTPRDTTEGQGAAGIGTNVRSDWAYPVRVLIADRSHTDDVSVLAKFDKWRQTIRRAFDRERLPGVPEVYMTTVEPGAVLQTYAVAGGSEFNVTASELTIRCHDREPKGL